MPEPNTTCWICLDPFTDPVECCACRGAFMLACRGCIEQWSRAVWNCRVCGEKYHTAPKLATRARRAMPNPMESDQLGRWDLRDDLMFALAFWQDFRLPRVVEIGPAHENQIQTIDVIHITPRGTAILDGNAPPVADPNAAEGQTAPTAGRALTTADPEDDLHAEPEEEDLAEALRVRAEFLERNPAEARRLDAEEPLIGFTGDYMPPISPTRELENINHTVGILSDPFWGRLRDRPTGGFETW